MNRSTCLLLITIVGSLGLSGCSTRPVINDPELMQCWQQLESLQNSINQHDVQDAQYQPVAGFPTYRSNRFWSSFEPRALSKEQQYIWRRQLHDLGMQSLALEWRNLPSATHAAVPDFNRFRQQCDERLFQYSLQQPIDADAIRIADSYNDLNRFLGLYALIKYAAAGSIAEYQQEMRERIDAFTELQPPTRRYRPPSTSATKSAEFEQWLAQGYQQHPLAVPQLNAGQLEALFLHHAPALEISQQSNADIPGTAQWQRNKDQLIRHINTQRTSIYTYPSYIRFQDSVLLQLNYTLWFSQRPKPTPDDWYGGKLDGLVWRVTLQQDGSVLFYDSIHPCGCYHSVHIPVHSPLAAKVQAHDQSDTLEPILFFPSTLSATDRPRLHLQADTHYLVNVTPDNADTSSADSSSTYHLQAYDNLRALAAGEGSRNWFDADGLIASSARRERYFLWPLGVENAGAMRQRGNHAIAFAGKRHFDEADVATLLNLPPTPAKPLTHP